MVAVVDPKELELETELVLFEDGASVYCTRHCKPIGEFVLDSLVSTVAVTRQMRLYRERGAWGGAVGEDVSHRYECVSC